MEKVNYLAQPNCYKLTNGTVEVIVTTDIGPRIIRYGFPGEENILGEVPDAVIKTALGDWKPWGGHRLWAAPESNPRSYSPDNSPIEFESAALDSIRLLQPVEPQTGIQKELTVTLDPAGSSLTILHRLINRGLWTINLASWALTIMNGGGLAIIPQEPYRSWEEELLPARQLVLWHYTDLSDARWAFGPKYIRLKTDETMAAPQKLGVANKQGWAAYHRQNTLFIKQFGYVEGASYPDYGCNNELYTAGSFIEVESLGPLTKLEPDAATIHIERWSLHRHIELDGSEESITAALKSCLVHA
ncbi:MAG TPA: hypothetical protein VGC64_06385 [Pyrinomonadaceae bacterium]